MQADTGRRLISSLVAAMFVLLMAQSAVAQVIGEGGVVTVGGTTYRLWGVVLPSPQRRCGDGWGASARSVGYLEKLVDGRVVDCEFRGKDEGGGTVAVCRADGQDVGGELVRSGLAWAALSESHAYVLNEAQAMSRVLGVHAHGCPVPLQGYPNRDNRIGR